MHKHKARLEAWEATPASNIDNKGTSPETALRGNDETTLPISSTSTKMIMNTIRTKKTNHQKMWSMLLSLDLTL
jgi:hypothetical protein